MRCRSRDFSFEGSPLSRPLFKRRLHVGNRLQLVVVPASGGVASEPEQVALDAQNLDVVRSHVDDVVVVRKYGGKTAPKTAVPKQFGRPALRLTLTRRDPVGKLDRSEYQRAPLSKSVCLLKSS